MSKKTPKLDNYRDDEIDLKKLFQAIGGVFTSFIAGIINLIIRLKRVSIKYRVLILIMAIFGIFKGVTSKFLNKPTYNASMLLSSDYFKNEWMEAKIEKLNILCKKNNAEELARVLNIDIYTASNVQKITFKSSFKERKNALEKTGLKIKNSLATVFQDTSVYEISVIINDSKNIQKLEKGIVLYFKNSVFIKKRINATKKSQLSFIKKLNRDIEQLDSLKKLFNLNLRANAKKSNFRREESVNLFSVESGLLNPVVFYSEGVNLYEKLEDYEKKIMISSDFELIDGFIATSKPSRIEMFIDLILPILYAISFAYLIIFLIEISKYLNQIEKKRFGKIER